MDEHYLKTELYDQVSRHSDIFEFIQAGSLDGIWYWDLQNPDVEWMSPEFWLAFGVDPTTKPHLASAWQDIIDPDDLKLALENFEKHVEDPSHPYDQIVRYRHTDGSTVWIRCRGMAVRDESGKAIRMLGAHTNITDFKENYLDEIVGSLSHDFRAPLRRVIQFAELIDQKIGSDFDEETKIWFDFIKQNSELMQHMIDDLTDLTKIVKSDELGEEVDLKQVIELSKSVLANEIKTENAEVRILGETPRVKGVASLLERLFRNLIDNAIKHRSESPPVIEISVVPEGNKALVSITDNGIGIEAKHLPNIFELFTRFHQPKDRKDGSGTGLAICRRIAQKHGTGIEVQSTPGEGSTFMFRLELA